MLWWCIQNGNQISFRFWFNLFQRLFKSIKCWTWFMKPYMTWDIQTYKVLSPHSLCLSRYSGFVWVVRVSSAFWWCHPIYVQAHLLLLEAVTRLSFIVSNICQASCFSQLLVKHSLPKCYLVCVCVCVCKQSIFTVKNRTLWEKVVSVVSPLSFYFWK